MFVSVTVVKTELLEAREVGNIGTVAGIVPTIGIRVIRLAVLVVMFPFLDRGST